MSADVKLLYFTCPPFQPAVWFATLIPAHDPESITSPEANFNCIKVFPSTISPPSLPLILYAAIRGSPETTVKVACSGRIPTENTPAVMAGK